jgi:hypothetical protein
MLYLLCSETCGMECLLKREDHRFTTALVFPLQVEDWSTKPLESWLVITTAWNCYQSRSAGSGSTCPGCRSGSAKMMQIWPDPVPPLVISKVKFLNTPYAIQNVESKQCREASTLLTWNRYTVLNIPYLSPPKEKLFYASRTRSFPLILKRNTIFLFKKMYCTGTV